MGKAIEKIAPFRKHQIVYRINSGNTDLLKQISKKDVDIAMEFSTPSTAFENIKICLEKHIPVVAGTTGWIEKKNEIENFCNKKNGTFFYTSNYSIGVNVLFKINEFLAKLMSHYPEFDVSIREEHHTQKKDAPSGTAMALAQGIIANHPAKNKWQLNQPGIPPSHDIIYIESVREGNITGDHCVSYLSPLENLKISHHANDRECFAMGAIMAGEFCISNSGVLGMDDLLFDDNFEQ